MGPNSNDAQHTRNVRDSRIHSVLIAAHVEHQDVVSENAGLGKSDLDVGRTGPVRDGDFLQPSRQPPSTVWMLALKRSDHVASNYSHTCTRFGTITYVPVLRTYPQLRPVQVLFHQAPRRRLARQSATSSAGRIRSTGTLVSRRFRACPCDEPASRVGCLLGSARRFTMRIEGAGRSTTVRIRWRNRTRGPTTTAGDRTQELGRLTRTW